MTDTITIAQTGAVQEVEFEEGMNLTEALEKAGMAVGEGMEVRLNSAACEDLETVLQSGDQILIVGAIRGA